METLILRGRLRDQGCARVERHDARPLAAFYDRLLESDHQGTSRHVTSKLKRTSYCAPAACLLPMGTHRRAEAARGHDSLHGEQLPGARKRLTIYDPVR